MEADSPWESMRAEQENGELLSVDEREEAAGREEREEEKVSVKEARSENCGDRVLHCLSQVPCASLIAWIILLTGLGGLTGSLLIGVQKTRDFLDMDDLFWFLEYTLIGVVVGMFVIGTILLCVGHISTDPTSRHLFHTTKKNYCAQGLNIFMLVFSYLLGICWIVVTAILGVPVYLLLNYILIRDDVTSFNLVHYGLGNITVQGENDLDNYRNEAKQEIISYSAAFISSLLIAISMIHFMLVLSANIKHLRESRFATLHAYDVDDTANSKTPMVADTTM
ncbi:hypothetical protein FSP39_007353 [Pinctada imbricata]|uniref:Neuronal membrane glycoprotein M6-b n=1 Tax=Pinctada imbricata TaxID=66713 RepID=A0AA88Y704_PINIB|nr:hypothetical protein FSP39_007353 [Pinctada imbricata]